MSTKMFQAIALAVSAVLFLTSCASSERMGRMSGMIRSYEKPRAERIENFSVGGSDTVSREEFSPLNDSLINLWPVFYRNRFYVSVLWPLIDSDPYGFAVRPFYNQEGNEYAVLFPLCAWNPVNGDGWIANSYWNRRCFGAAPFFHHSRGAEAFSYYALAWRHGDSWGVFPFARFGRGFSYAGPAWWSRNGEGGLESGGFFPMARFHRDFNFFGPAWWYRGGHVSWGVFPAARFSSEKDSLNYVGPFWRGGDSFGLFPAAKYSPKGISYAGPFWKDRSDGTFGIFPVFRFRNVLDHFLFPLYCIGDNGGFFLSPLAAWEKDRMFSILGPLYLVNRNRSEIRDDGNPMFYRGGGKSESCFRMFGLVGYAGSRSVCNWKKECDLTKLKTARVRDFAGHRPYLQYQLDKLGCGEKLPETDAGLKELKIRLKREVTEEKTDYFGIVPLFHYDASPAERTFRFLFCLPYYNKKAGSEELSFLGPFLFSGRKRQYTDRQAQIAAVEKNAAVSNSRLLSLPLLFSVETREYYADSPAARKLKKLIADFRKDRGLSDRAKIDGALRSLDPSLSLPESVTDPDSFQAFLGDVIAKQNLPTGSDWGGGCLPLFLKAAGTRHWIFPVLLSSFEKTEERTFFFSLPLLTRIRETPCVKQRHILFPFGWTESDKTYRRDMTEVCEQDGIFQNDSHTEESRLGILLWLYHRNESTGLVALRKGEAAGLNRLRGLLRSRMEHLKRIAAEEPGNMEKRKKLEKELAGRTGKEIPLSDAAACRKAAETAGKDGSLKRRLRMLAKDYDGMADARGALQSSEKELRDLLAVFGIFPEGRDLLSAEKLKSCFDSLYGTRIGERRVKRYGTWFSGREVCGDDYRWHVGFFLANGSGIGGCEEVRILRWLYRFRRNGNRTETLFPFFSLQRDGADSRISFLWRVWERRVVNGKVSGHVFFIPFGERA